MDSEFVGQWSESIINDRENFYCAAIMMGGRTYGYAKVSGHGFDFLEGMRAVVASQVMAHTLIEDTAIVQAITSNILDFWMKWERTNGS